VLGSAGRWGTVAALAGAATAFPEPGAEARHGLGCPTSAQRPSAAYGRSGGNASSRARAKDARLWGAPATRVAGALASDPRR
jgi:hypothetical protein